MPATGPILAAETFLDRYGNAITAALTLLLSLGLLVVVHRALRARGRRLVEALGGDELSPVADTRLRFCAAPSRRSSS